MPPPLVNDLGDNYSQSELQRTLWFVTGIWDACVIDQWKNTTEHTEAIRQQMLKANNPVMSSLVDETLHKAPDNAIWAPLPVWRILAVLKMESAIPALLRQLRRIDEDDDDWIAHEFPEVFQAIGIRAITPLAEYISDSANSCWAKDCAAQCLVKISIAYPEQRGVCLEILTKHLQDFGNTNDHTVNACIINALLDLNATESIDIIRAAFDNDLVDISIVGDIEDVEIELRLRHVRTTPRKLNRLTHFIEKIGASIQRTNQNKIGRNDPCPCGSGKKFKKCCLN